MGVVYIFRVTLRLSARHWADMAYDYPTSVNRQLCGLDGGMRSTECPYF